MNRLHASAFALPDRLAAKADPALIAADEQHFAAIAHALDEAITDLTSQLDERRRMPSRIEADSGTEALERDQEIHRLTARLRLLRRFGLDLCLGHLVTHDGPVYIGRLGLTGTDGQRLLLDWRGPAAEPFFAATHATPMGLVSRRRYRWTRGQITDYWDEVFTADGLQSHAAALDDQSAFIASLGTSRSPRMRDVLGTIQADQDAIIRAGSRGALVVDGGPGTGKTVVALHRSAYLLYADPRIKQSAAHHRGDVLFVGPHEPYLAYVSDVLPSLGEDGVQTCTLRDLLPEGASAAHERDPEVARLKAKPELVQAIEAAVRFYEDPPATPLEVTTPWGNAWLGATDWAAAFDAVEPGTAHNQAHEQIWAQLTEILLDQFDQDEVSPEQLRRALQQDRDLVTALNRAWPLLDPADVAGDLWSVPAYLRKCAPSLTSDEIRILQRTQAPQAWTLEDLPILDAARRRLGDPEATRRQRRQDALRAAERARRSQVMDDLIASDDSEMHVMSMLRGHDLQNALDDDAAAPGLEPDQLAGPFAHIVVDEAQELTGAQWQMLLARCPSRSFTIVGDRAQARHGFTESWSERLARAGFGPVTIASLTINYRTPEEVMAAAEPVIRAALPDANVPVSIRSSGIPVAHGSTAELDDVLREWLAGHPDGEGIACVIGDPSFAERPRIRSLSPELAKGLEFDLVVLVDPDAFGAGIEGAVDRYVAMTRATQQLVILTSPHIPR